MFYVIALLAAQPVEAMGADASAAGKSECSSDECVPFAEAVAEEGADAAAMEASRPFIAKMPDGALAFAMIETARRKQDFTGPHVDMWFDHFWADGRSKKEFWRFWCETTKLDIITWTSYSKSGAVIRSTENPRISLSTGQYAIPGSIGEKMLRIACSQ